MAPTAAPSRVTSLEHTAIGAGAGMLEVIVMQPMVAFKNALQEGRPLPKTPLALYRGLVVSWSPSVACFCWWREAGVATLLLLGLPVQCKQRPWQPVPQPPPTPHPHRQPDQLLQHGAHHSQPVWDQPDAGASDRQVSGAADQPDQTPWLGQTLSARSNP